MIIMIIRIPKTIPKMMIIDNDDDNDDYDDEPTGCL